MKITTVTFRAFDKSNRMSFIDKTYEEIHAALTAVCNTYIPTDIMEATGATFQPLSKLTDLQK